MTKDQTLLSIARSYVYGLGATFADLEEAVRSAVEPKPRQRMSRAEAQQGFDALERAYWKSVEIVEPPEADQCRVQHAGMDCLLDEGHEGPHTFAQRTKPRQDQP